MADTPTASGLADVLRINPYQMIMPERMVFPFPMATLNKARNSGFKFTGRYTEPDARTHDSKPLHEQPRLWASRLGGCHRKSWYEWLIPKVPIEDQGLESIERGVQTERSMALLLEYMASSIDNEAADEADRSDIAAVGTQERLTGYPFTEENQPKQPLQLTGSSDFWILWRRHPDTGGWVFEVGDFKAHGDFAYGKLHNGDQGVNTSYVMQAAVGAWMLGRHDKESQPRKTAEALGVDIDSIPLSWRIVAIAMSPKNWQSRVIDGEESRFSLEYSSLLTSGIDPETGLEDQSTIMEGVVSDFRVRQLVYEQMLRYVAGEEVQVPRRVIPFRGMGKDNEVTEWTADNRGNRYGVWYKGENSKTHEPEAIDEHACRYCEYHGPCSEESGLVGINSKPASMIEMLEEGVSE